MNWISVKDKLPDTETGECLVQYLETFFGIMASEITIGYYDNPDGYLDESKDEAEGWKTWSNEKCILVTHWMPIPKKITTVFDGMKQTDFIKEYGQHPDMGNCIE